MERLKGLDPVAYVRFASIYREFKDVNTFMDEIKNTGQPVRPGAILESGSFLPGTDVVPKSGQIKGETFIVQ